MKPFTRQLRDEMVVVTEEARAAERGIWSDDRSTKGFQVDIPPDLSELAPIFPKIWRRLQSFYQRRSNRDKGLEVFIQELSRGKDRLFTIPDQRSIKFSTALKVDGNKITMLYKPEEMVFESDIRLQRLAASITTSSILA